MKIQHIRLPRTVLGIMLGCLLAACSSATQTPQFPDATQPEVETEESPATAGASTETPTPQPAGPSVLSICMAQEPTSLFIYGDTSPGAASVYQAIYDGPVDSLDYILSPVILQQMPTLENGGIRLEAVEVSEGDLIINAEGDWTTLGQGVLYRPSGCTSLECAITYGEGTVSIDRMAASFTLKEGLKWSDGATLTADDSVYSYEVARALFPAYRPDLINLTASYQAIDALTVEWRSVPGYQGAAETFFFQPLPRHAWGAIDPEALYTDETVTHQPIGWGPYKIDSWVEGDHITFNKNPNYFRVSEGLPRFDHLVFRFVNNGEEALDALRAGECQLIDQTVNLEPVEGQLANLENQGAVKLASLPFTGWEVLTFGTSPYDPARPAPFASQEVRQAAAYCIDRTAVAQAAGEQAMTTYLPAGHPEANTAIEDYATDPQKGADLLESAGWVDGDGNPATPRTAQGAPGFVDGTALSVKYYVPDDAERAATAEVIAQGLERCGFAVETISMSWNELMTAGPEGPVFGRSFDLAQLGWAGSLSSPCSLYLSSEIPGPYPEYVKGWGGANAGGFSSSDYDAACRAALYSLPGSEAQAQATMDAQELFAEEVPALPLYQHSAVVASATEICGVETHLGEDLLWNLEELGFCE